MQYTIRRVPKEVDRALRERALRRNLSVNEAALEVMAEGLGIDLATPLKRRDLSDLAGAWVKDKAVDAALADQRRIDAALWR
ncbi:MAG: hypothetical protein Q8N26_01690 [Myxococcales bacterium]|nr:hypothetical protein [Myxococcales bacterium]